MRKHKTGGLLALLLFCACTHSPLVMPEYSGQVPNVDFKFELSGDVNGSQFAGVGAIPLSPDNKYTMHVTSNYDVNYMTVTSCNRDWYDQDSPVDKSSWFKPHHDFSYEFSLVPGVEDTGICHWQICAYNMDGNPQDCALLEFITSDATLPAYNKCDGDQGKTHGVSICQSKAGLDEEIDFDTPVVTAWDNPNYKGDEACKPHKPDDGMHWLYTLPQKVCTINFMEVAKPHRIHRHVFRGYKSIQLQGH